MRFALLIFLSSCLAFDFDFEETEVFGEVIELSWKEQVCFQGTTNVQGYPVSTAVALKFWRYIANETVDIYAGYAYSTPIYRFCLCRNFLQHPNNTGKAVIGAGVKDPTGRKYKALYEFQLDPQQSEYTHDLSLEPA